MRYRPIGASALLRRNLWIYGLGGIIAPFIGIKLIDLIVHNLLGESGPLRPELRPRAAEDSVHVTVGGDDHQPRTSGSPPAKVRS